MSDFGYGVSAALGVGDCRVGELLLPSTGV